MDSEIIIIGSGPWGKALAFLCKQKNPLIKIILVTRTASTLPPLPDVLNIPNISQSNSLATTVNKNSNIIIATPSASIAEILCQLKSLNHQGHILCTSKGFINDTPVKYPHEFHKKIHTYSRSFSYLYGPTFADEILQGLPSQAVLGTSTQKCKTLWKNLLNHQNFQIIVSPDLKGLIWCSVFKNIVAIISGCMHACRLGQNAQALLITHATIELQSMLKKINGKSETAFSIAGLGDIVLSASSDKSRNFRFGLALANLQKCAHKKIEGMINLKLINDKLHALKKKKTTIIQLAEDCVTSPHQCKTLIKKWLQKKAGYHS